MEITTASVVAALEAAEIAARPWNKGQAPRVYLQIDRSSVRAALGLTSSQARQMERQGGVYVELKADEALVQGVDGSAEAKIVGVLVSAGIAAR